MNALRVLDHLAELGRRVGNLDQQAQGDIPAVGRRAQFAAPLVQFGQPDQRHQVELVDRQRLLERLRSASSLPARRCALARFIHKAVAVGSASCGGGKMPDRRRRIARFERRQAERITTWGRLWSAIGMRAVEATRPVRSSRKGSRLVARLWRPVSAFRIQPGSER